MPQQIKSFPSVNFDINCKIPICVNNCGYYKNVVTPIPVNRPLGRPDYQLLLPVSGSMMIDKKRVCPGEIFLYCPNVPQNYTYFEGEGTEYYWIHFHGCDMERICNELPLKNGVYPLLEGRKEVENLVRMTVKAFADEYDHASEYGAGLLLAILAMIASPPTVSTPFNRAMNLLRDPSCDLTITELARLYDMSDGHFIRSFKRYTGLSPNAFRIKSRLDISCSMLLSTKMSIGEISSFVGFSDPLYFSRLFKKHLGLSPVEYRKARPKK